MATRAHTCPAHPPRCAPSSCVRVPAGDWRNHFSPELSAAFRQAFRTKMRSTPLVYDLGNTERLAVFRGQRSKRYPRRVRPEKKMKVEEDSESGDGQEDDQEVPAASKMVKRYDSSDSE